MIMKTLKGSWIPTPHKLPKGRPSSPLLSHRGILEEEHLWNVNTESDLCHDDTTLAGEALVRTSRDLQGRIMLLQEASEELPLYLHKSEQLDIMHKSLGDPSNFILKRFQLSTLMWMIKCVCPSLKKR